MGCVKVFFILLFKLIVSLNHGHTQNNESMHANLVVENVLENHWRKIIS